MSQNDEFVEVPGLGKVPLGDKIELVIQYYENEEGVLFPAPFPAVKIDGVLVPDYRGKGAK